MAQRLTDAIVKRLPVPTERQQDPLHSDVGGFGARVTAAGARAYVLTYRVRAGRQRRFTIGQATEWQCAAARDEAKRLKQRVDQGGDPLASSRTSAAPAMCTLCADRFEAEHLPRKRESTQSDYRRLVRLYIRPALGRMKVAAVAWSDIDAMHRRITKAGHPYQANRVIATASKMFSLAIRWRMRPDNPVKGIERNQEHKRALSRRRRTGAAHRGAGRPRRPRGGRYRSPAAADRLPPWRSHGRAVGRPRPDGRDLDQAGKLRQAAHRSCRAAVGAGAAAAGRDRDGRIPNGCSRPSAAATGSLSRRTGRRSAGPPDQRPAHSRPAAFVREPTGERGSLAAADRRTARSQQPGHDAPLRASVRRFAACRRRACRRRDRQRRQPARAGNREPRCEMGNSAGHLALRMCYGSTGSTIRETASLSGPMAGIPIYYSQRRSRSYCGLDMVRGHGRKWLD